VKLNFSKKTSRRVKSRLKNKVRIRKKVKGTAERPRLCVYRSLKNVYAQIIDDVSGVTITASSSLDQKTNSREVAKQVGIDIAKKALAKDIKSIVFDRGGYIYHGKIKSLADGAREGGLNF
jgi:large subunit ribosomal protein L18